MIKSAIYLLFFALVINANNPQVHEDVDESSSRQVRDPFHPRAHYQYQPQVFDYLSAHQQQPDPRRHRYAQQQEIDSKHILGDDRNQHGKNLISPSHQQTIKTFWSKIAAVTTPKPLTRVSRKLKPSAYFEDVDDEDVADKRDILKHPVKRQDQTNQLIYINPESVRQHFQNNAATEEELQALNALIGKNPSVQLEGLQKILQSAQKDHTPITEDQDDVAPESYSSVQKESIESIQAQLDQVAKIATEKALARAQEEAMQQVQAQHAAILKQQQELQKEALAKIAAHNQEHQQQPVALPLKASPPPNYENIHQHQNIYHTASVQPAQVYVQAPKVVHVLPKKISVTKTVTQGRHVPSSGYHEQVVLETQQKIYPNSVDQHTVDNQYASKYAFGYRIKDVKKGNDFGHEEKRDGKNAKGQYHVLLPDGRVQKVEYFADPSGYHAKVTYENVAHH